MQQDQNDKHGPRLDEQLGHETEGMVRGGHSTHAEDFKTPEPETNEPVWDPLTTTGPRREGSPPGMSPGDVEERSALARFLTGVRYPATPGEMIEHVSGADAPDTAIAALETLPDRPYENLADVAEELGYGREEHRF
ncbi:DUF2795 domain-containing protein [Actinomadura viridis]|uniref:DUF2795 domain-containing protein n=1 Tax=Actinomadura viridis TaxID=58110 RepID=UPI003693158D